MTSSSKSVSKISCGLDFGTSNSAIAICDHGTSAPKHLEMDRSTLFFPDAPAAESVAPRSRSGGGRDRRSEAGCLFGEAAFISHFDDGNPGRYIKSIKSILPHESFKGSYINGKWYTIDDLIASLLRHLKDRAEAAVQTEIRGVVLGRPVRFSDDSRKDSLAQDRLKNAAIQAGFQEISFQLEPIAAAFSYELQLNGSETVLIGDLGAGTSDFTIIELGPSKVVQVDRKKDVIGSAGIHVGGDVFDADIMWNKVVDYFGYGAHYDLWGKQLEVPPNIFRNLCNWEWLAFLRDTDIREQLRLYQRRSDRPKEIERLVRLIDWDLGYDLLYEVEKAKIALAAVEVAGIRLDKMDLGLDEQLSRAEFGVYTQNNVDRIDQVLRVLFLDSGVKESDIDAVFLTGGTSLSFVIKNLLGRRFGYHKIREGDPFKSVSIGLALSAARLFQ